MSSLSKRVLLTGASGFLGSHIAEELVATNFEVIATKRAQTDLWRCKDFKDKINWVNIDDPNWQQVVIDLRPSIIIHSAWIGVAATTRMDWESQFANITFVYDLLQIAEAVHVEVFIGLGSQAEYGVFDGKVNEDQPANPTTAYGTVKLMIYELVKGFFTSPHLQTSTWYWLRLFSFFGEKEDATWLIPATVDKLMREEEMDFTLGEQKYAYLYVKDLSIMLRLLLESTASSGVYNISSISPIAIKDLIEQIKRITKSNTKLNFGALPYRIGQSMHIEGDMSKFKQQVGHYKESDLYSNLTLTVQSYIAKDEIVS